MLVKNSSVCLVKNFLLCVVVLFSFACDSSVKNTPEQLPKELPVEHSSRVFIDLLKEADSTTIAMFVVEAWLSNWSTAPKNKALVSYTRLHEAALQQFQKNIQRNEEYQVYSWKEAKEFFPKRVNKEPAPVEEVTVILTNQTVFYLKMKNKQYHSLLPFIEGNRITRWM